MLGQIMGDSVPVIKLQTRDSFGNQGRLIYLKFTNLFWQTVVSSHWCIWCLFIFNVGTNLQDANLLMSLEIKWALNSEVLLWKYFLWLLLKVVFFLGISEIPRTLVIKKLKGVWWNVDILELECLLFDLFVCLDAVVLLQGIALFWQHI